jgi:hypothetical protein
MPVENHDDGSGWSTRIVASFTRRPAPLNGKTYIRKWPTASRPVALSCDDGQVYVVKGRQAGRQAINDHIVSALGALLGAPTARPALVRVDQGLIDAERELQDLHGSGPFVAGVWHGTLHVGNVSDDREAFAHQTVPENRLRFAHLAVLYGWAYTSQDHQFLYAKTEPRLVFSVDHGHFFPNGPDWTIASLQAHSTVAVPDPTITASCSLNSTEVREARTVLGGLDELREIAWAVAAPLEEWGLSMDERVAMAEYLARRRREMLGGL